ncbi:hypothetical protein ACFVHQ_10675 [Actinomycetes bacterium NPDC127524]
MISENEKNIMALELLKLTDDYFKCPFPEIKTLIYSDIELLKKIIY